jgi:hypothetical protein
LCSDWENSSISGDSFFKKIAVAQKSVISMVDDQRIALLLFADNHIDATA